MSAITTMVAVLKYVPTLQLGTSRVHAMLAIFSMLMVVYVMVGHTYTHSCNNLTEWNITVFYFTIDINECDNNNGGCSQICSNTPSGSFTCSCNTGYALNPNGSSCDGRSHVHIQQPHTMKDHCVLYLDINECDTNNGGCAQICANTPAGSFTCSCNAGYTLNANGSSCDGRSHVSHPCNNHTEWNITVFMCAFCFQVQFFLSVEI